MNHRIAASSRTAGKARPNVRRLVVWLTIGIFLAFAGFGAASANAAPTPMVDLGQASTYAVLSGASVGNTVSAAGAPHTTIRGDLGVKANTAPTGFPPGVVTGTTRFGSSVDPAHADLVSAYNEIASRPPGTPLAGALGGAIVPPGLHTIAGAASNTGTLTLDGGGDPDAVFVFQVNGALAFAAGSHVVLTNGAQASRVFWQVNGAGAVGAGSSFTGTLIAMDAVAMGNGTLVNGHAFARNGALTLDNNQFYSAPPVVTLTGGESAQTTDTTPTISGTTDVEAPGTVTVTVAGQTFTATPDQGTWSVTSGLLANGTYSVVASVEDGVGNPGSATQQLTVDTVLPGITLEGGESVITNNPTPTIAGTSDAAVDTVIRITVDSQVRQAEVQADGSWSVRLASIEDGTYLLTASVSDPAGNESTITQSLTIDTIEPVVTISGGPNALTNNATPQISGTADVTPGSTVTVDVANETVAGQVDGSGGWAVTAAALADGPHRVVVTVSDAAGNRTTLIQMLTVDTVAPRIAIDGGASATTRRTDPTIIGTSDAAPGAIITVSIAGQSSTTLLQADRSWNEYAGPIGEGTWQIVASVRDPAGNLGTFTQSLTIDSTDTTIDTAITSGPSGTTNNASPSFTFSGEPAGDTAKIQCRIDAEPFADCESPKTFTDLADGFHTVSFRAEDAVGNQDPTPAIRSFTVVTAAPRIAIDGGASATTRHTDPTIIGTSDVEPGATITVSIAGGSITTLLQADRSWSVDAGFVGDGTWQVVASVRDPAGNLGTFSQSLTIDSTDTTIDTTITSGPYGTINNASPSYTFSGDPAGDTAKIQCRIDAEPFADCESPKTFTDLADGPHTVSFRAEDAVGNQDPTPAIRSFTVDTTPPDTRIDTGPSGTIVASQASFTFSGDPAGDTARIQCRIDAEPFADCESPKTFTNLADGPHTATFRAEDAAGNQDPTPAIRSFTVDTTPPDTTIDTGPTGTIANNQATFTFAGIPAGDTAKVQCRIDGGSFTDCSSPKTFAGLADGPHTATFRAEDAAGNQDQSPATRTFTVGPSAACVAATTALRTANRVRVRARTDVIRARKQLSRASRQLKQAGRSRNASRVRRANRKARILKRKVRRSTAVLRRANKTATRARTNAARTCSPVEPSAVCVAARTAFRTANRVRVRARTDVIRARKQLSRASRQLRQAGRSRNASRVRRANRKARILKRKVRRSTAVLRRANKTVTLAGANAARTCS